jgi:hypothetical protein
MSQIDYALMIDRELKQYFLEHRNDVEAVRAYMDRRYARSPQNPIVAADEVDLSFSEQIKLIDERMRSRFKEIEEA